MHVIVGIGGISVSPNAQRLRFYFATEPYGFFTADKVVEYLRDLLRHLRGNVIVVWDRGGNPERCLVNYATTKTCNECSHKEQEPFEECQYCGAMFVLCDRCGNTISTGGFRKNVGMCDSCWEAKLAQDKS